MSESSNTNNSAKSYHFCKHLHKAKNALDECLFQIEKAENCVSFNTMMLGYVKSEIKDMELELSQIESKYKKE